MLKQLKENELYFVIRINEPYAEKIYAVLKEEQTKLGDWPEGNISFGAWIVQTFGQEGANYVDKETSKESVGVTCGDCSDCPLAARNLPDVFPLETPENSVYNLKIIKE